MDNNDNGQQWADRRTDRFFYTNILVDTYFLMMSSYLSITLRRQSHLLTFRPCYLLINHEVPEGLEVVTRGRHCYEAPAGGPSLPVPHQTGPGECLSLAAFLVSDWAVVQHGGTHAVVHRVLHLLGKLLKLSSQISLIKNRFSSRKK